MALRAFIGVLILALGAVAFFWSRAGTVAGPEARRLVSGGARLVDVRTPEEFAEGHIDGAVNIPVQELSARLGEVGQKDTEVVVYCRSGKRSHQAKQLLKEAGFTAVHDLGGMSRW